MNADLTSSSSPSMKIIFPSDSASFGPSIVPSKFLCVCFFYFGGFYGGVGVISELIIVISREIGCSNNSYSTC